MCTNLQTTIGHLQYLKAVNKFVLGLPKIYVAEELYNYCYMISELSQRSPKPFQKLQISLEHL